MNITTATKSNIAQAATLIPALVLTKKAVSEFGWKASLRGKTYYPIYRSNKVVTALYVAGIAASAYFLVKKAVEDFKAGRDFYDLDQDFLDVEEVLTPAQLEEELTELARYMFGDLTEVKVIGMEDMPVDLLEKIHGMVGDLIEQQDDGPLADVVPLTPPATYTFTPGNYLHVALRQKVQAAYDEIRNSDGEYNVAQGYLADIRGTLWVREGEEPEASQMVSALHYLNQLANDVDANDWGRRKAHEMLDWYADMATTMEASGSHSKYLVGKDGEKSATLIVENNTEVEIKLCQASGHGDDEIVLDKDGSCPFPEEHDLSDRLFTPLSERE